MGSFSKTNPPEGGKRGVLAENESGFDGEKASFFGKEIRTCCAMGDDY